MTYLNSMLPTFTRNWCTIGFCMESERGYFIEEGCLNLHRRPSFCKKDKLTRNRYEYAQFIKFNCNLTTTKSRVKYIYHITFSSKTI